MQGLFPLRGAALVAGSLPLLFVVTSSQTEVLVATGDVLPGYGVVDEVIEIATDDAGNWIAAVHAAGLPANAQALVLNGAVVLKAGDPLPGPVPGSTFTAGGALWVDGAGNYGWAAIGSSSSAGNVSGLYLNQTPLALVNDLVGAPGITPGTTYQSFYDQSYNGSGSLIAHATMNDPAIVGISDNVLLRLDPQPGGGVVATDLFKRGDFLPGQASPIHEFAEVGNALASNSGLVLHLPTFQNGVTAVYLDQVPLAMAGEQSPVFGRSWSYLRRMPVALNEAGDFAFGGRLSGDPLSDQLLVWNGIVLAQEGDSLPSIAPFRFTSLGLTGFTPADLRLTESGQVLWYGEWDDPDTTRNSGLFLDHELILQEGVTWIDGAQIDDFVQAALIQPRPIFDISSDGSTIVFRAALSDGRTGVFQVRPAGSAQTIQGCLPNPGILISNAQPKLGLNYSFNVENAQADGVSGVVLCSLQTAPGFPPCGVSLPGLGELLVSTVAPDPSLVVPGLFPAFNGLTIALLGTIPNNPKLFGLTFFAQGLWIDTLGVAPAEPLRLTNALELSIGM